MALRAAVEQEEDVSQGVLPTQGENGVTTDGRATYLGGCPCCGLPVAFYVGSDEEYDTKQTIAVRFRDAGQLPTGEANGMIGDRETYLGSCVCRCGRPMAYFADDDTPCELQTWALRNEELRPVTEAV